MVHRLTSSHSVILIIDSDNVSYLQCGGERGEGGMGEGRGRNGGGERDGWNSACPSGKYKFMHLL